MILSYIQDIGMDNSSAHAENVKADELWAIAAPETQDTAISEAVIAAIPKHNIDKIKDTGKSPNSLDDSFESKYAQFKEKIERDRLAWETLAKRIT